MSVKTFHRLFDARFTSNENFRLKNKKLGQHLNVDFCRRKKETAKGKTWRKKTHGLTGKSTIVECY